MLFAATRVEYLADTVETQRLNKAAGAALSDRTGDSPDTFPKAYLAGLSPMRNRTSSRQSWLSNPRGRHSRMSP
jgi:hypothetical protein